MPRAIGISTSFGGRIDSGRESGARGARLAVLTILLAAFLLALLPGSAAAAPPGNDDFADRTELSGPLPISDSGTTVEATKETGEDDHAGDSGHGSVWYEWTPDVDTSATVAVDACPYGGFGSLIAVYTGTDVASLTPVSSTMAGCPGAEVSFEATGGQTYVIAVDTPNIAPDPTGFDIGISEPTVAANDDFGDAEILSGPLPLNHAGTNEGATKQPGEDDHAGDPGGASVWFSWTPVSDTSVRIDDGACSALLAVYTGTAVDALTEVASSGFGCPNQVGLDAIGGTTYWIAIDAPFGSTGSYDLTIEEFAPLPNDNFADAIELSGPMPINESGTNDGATKEPGEPNHAGEPGGASVWYEWTPEASGPVAIRTLSTCAIVAVYEGTAVNGLSEVGSVGPFDCPAPASFDAIAGTTYKIAVDAAFGSGGPFDLRIRELTPPANDDFTDATELSGALPINDSGTNVDATSETDEPAHPGGGGSSVWYEWTPASDVAAAIEADPCGSGSPGSTVVAVYTGTALNNLTEVGSGSGSCTSKAKFDAAAATTYWIAVDKGGSGEGPFDITLRELDPPANDDLTAARTLSGPLPITDDATNVDATSEPDEPDHAGQPAEASVWFEWTPDSTGQVKVYGTCGSSLAVYTGSDYGSLTEQASSAFGSGCPSPVLLDAQSGVTYLIAADSLSEAESEFELRIREFAPPANDDFASAQTLGGALPIDESGSTLDASREPNEPDHAFGGGDSSVWYSWSPSAPGPVAVQIDACDPSSFRTPSLAVYTGGALGSLVEVGSANGCGAKVSFEGSATTDYKIAVDDGGMFGGEGGAFDLQVRTSTPPANDDFANAEALTGGLPITAPGTTRDATIEPNEPDHGVSPTTTVWYSWTAPAGGGDVVLEGDCPTNPSPTAAAVYEGAAINSLTQIANGGFGCANRIDFEAVGGTTYWIAIGGFGSSEEGPFELTLRELDPPGNDDFTDSEVLGAGGASGTTRDATAEPGEPSHAAATGGPPNPASASVWYSWTAPASGEVSVEADGCGADDTAQLIAAYSGDQVDGLTPIAGQQFAIDACASTLTFDVASGTTYRIAVEGDTFGSGDFDLTVSGAGPDTTAPDTVIDSGPAEGSTIADASPQFEFSGDPAGDTDRYECKVDTGSFGPCTSPETIGPLSDGEHTFQVRAIDAADNADESPASRTFTVDTTVPDTTAPDTSIDLGPAEGSTIANDSPEFEFSGTPGDTDRFECKVDGDPFAACTSPETIGPLSDGEHTFQVRAIDAADNADVTPATRTFTVDATAPDTAIDLGPAEGSTIVEPSPEFEFSGAPGADVAGFECKVDDGSFGPCASPETIGPLDDGEHTFRVRAVDAVGNADDSPAARTFTVDASAPETQIDSGPADGSSIANDSPEFGFSGTPAGDVDRFECKLDEGTFEACASPEAIGPLSEGEHTFQVRAIDAAGNADPAPASSTFTVDLTPPETSIDDGPDEGSTIGDPTPELVFSGSPGTDVDHLECKLDDGSFETCTSPRTPAELADGEHTFRARAVDAAGNADPTPAERTFTVDTEVPSLAIDSGPDGPTNDAEPEFGFTAEAGSALECSIDDGTAAFGACDTGATHGPAAALPEGEYTFRVKATDAAGNSTTRTREFTVDTTAPETSIASGPAGTSRKLNPSFALGSSEAGSTFECRLDSAQESDFAPCDSPKAYSGLADGAHAFDVRATDPAGNTDAGPATRSWTIDTAATEETTVGEAPPGGTVSTSPGGDEPDEQTPVHTAIKTPSGGEVTIVESQTTTQTPPEGFEIFGQEIEITADPATVEEPLELSFVLDSSLIPDGTDISLITVFRDGEPAGDCDGSGQAVPDPCIAERELLGSGDLEITALTAHASAWNLGTAPDTTAPDTAIDSGPAPGSTIDDPTPTFEFSGSPAGDVDRFECKVDGGSFAGCSSPKTLDALDDGEHSFRVRAVDAAGNADPAPASRTFTVDTTVDSPEPPEDPPGGDDPPPDPPADDDPPPERPPVDPGPPDQGDPADSKACEKAQNKLAKKKGKVEKKKAKKRKAKKRVKKARKSLKKAKSSTEDRKSLRKAKKKAKQAKKKFKKQKRKFKRAKSKKRKAQQKVAKACGG